MNDYDFSRCKLCGVYSAEPAYDLGDALIYCCPGCDFHYLNQLDTFNNADRQEKSLDEAARRYIDSRLDEGLQLLPKRLALVHEHTILADARCLDIGAGVGQFLALLKQERAEGMGIEPSLVRRQYAQEKYGISLRGELIESDFWQQNYSEHFSVISLWDVIEHVNFPFETLRAAEKVLQPGGFIFLDTPSRETVAYRLSEKINRFSQGRVSLFLPSFYSAAPYGHKQIFKPAQLIELLEGLGLERQAVRKSYSQGLLQGDKAILVFRKPQ